MAVNVSSEVSDAYPAVVFRDAFPGTRTVPAMPSAWKKLRLPVAVSAFVVLASCSSNTPSGDGSARTRDRLLVAASDDVRVLRSDEDDSMYAVDCVGGPSLRLAEGVEVSDAPSGVEVAGDLVSFPAGDGGYRLTLLDAGDRTEVRVRCLPEGFPDVRVDGRFSDWLALTTINTEPDVKSFQMVVDSSGFPVWFRDTEVGFADFTIRDGMVFSFTRGQRALFSFSNEPGFGFHLERLDGTLVKEWVPRTGLGLDHHSGEPLPNGNILALLYEESDLPFVSPAGPLPTTPMGDRRDCPEAEPSSADRTIRGRIVEVDPSGGFVHVWRLEEFLPDFASSSTWVNLDTTGLRCLVDVDHLNSLAFYPDAPGSSTGRVLLTGRHIDAAVMLAWPSGEVLWTLGGRENDRSLGILDDPFAGPVRPHDAGLIDEDHILIYDNRDGETSRAVVYRLDLRNRTAALVESYTTMCGTSPCSAFAMGSSRLTLDGSGVVVGWGTASVTASEFRRGEASPSAELVLGSSWPYRVLPVASLSHRDVFDAQTAGR